MDDITLLPLRGYQRGLVPVLKTMAAAAAAIKNVYGESTRAKEVCWVGLYGKGKNSHNCPGRTLWMHNAHFSITCRHCRPSQSARADAVAGIPQRSTKSTQKFVAENGHSEQDGSADFGLSAPTDVVPVAIKSCKVPCQEDDVRWLKSRASCGFDLFVAILLCHAFS